MDMQKERETTSFFSHGCHSLDEALATVALAFSCQSREAASKRMQLEARRLRPSRVCVHIVLGAADKTRLAHKSESKNQLPSSFESSDNSFLRD